MFELIGPKIVKYYLNNMLLDFDRPKILPQYSLMYLVSLCKVLALLDVRFKIYL